MTGDRWRVTPGRFLGFLGGLGTCSVALSTGFIWAYQGRTLRVFVAAFLAWTGYLAAHYAATGRFIDDGSHDDPGPEGYVPDSTWRKVGVALGAGILVAGMVIGAVYIRLENHLATNVGGVLFLGGYVVAHYAETDLLL